MDPMTLALLSLGISAFGVGSNWYFGNEQQKLNQAEYYENLTSNYYSYMDQLNQMQGALGQNQLAINQNAENIASTRNYLDRWSEEYDASMKATAQQGMAQYQQMAGNFSAGLVSAAETGRRGGSAALLNQSAGRSLSDFNSQLQYGLRSSALDMLADRQTAASSINTSYQAIGAYKDAMQSLSGSISSMQNTTEGIQRKLKKEGITV